MYQVPWNNYTEEEIQDIVSYIFELKGYNVYNIHKVQKNAESGADLECTRDFESDKILIAIKKKPRKKDIQQLNELKGRAEKMKIYIYINEPTKFFKDEMNDDVIFWNSMKLTYELYNSDLKFYIFLIYENLYENKLYEIRDRFIEFKKIVDNDKTFDTKIELEYNLINALYHAKDRSTSFNKTMLHLQIMYENMQLRNIDDTYKEEIVYGYIKLLEQLHYDSIKPLCNLLNSILDDYEDLIKIWCYQTNGRSNWRFFYSYSPKLTSGFLKIYKKNEYHLMGKSYSKPELSSILADISKIIGNVAYWYEDTVDDLFNILLFGNYNKITDELIDRLNDNEYI